MKRKLITLLMVVALVAGMTTLLASAATVNLGSFTWLGLNDGSGYMMGWHTVESAENDGGGATSNGLTTAQLLKATHLVLELSEAPTLPEGHDEEEDGAAFILYWQSNVNDHDWNQVGLWLSAVESYLDGLTLTIPFDLGIEDYSIFSPILDEYEDFEGNADVKIGIGYWHGPTLDEWVVSARVILPDESTPPPARPSAQRDSVPPTGDEAMEQSALTTWLLIGTFAAVAVSAVTVAGVRKFKKSHNK